MILEDKASEIANELMGDEYGITIELVAAILSVIVSLYKLSDACNKKQDFESFTKVSPFEWLMIKKMVTRRCKKLSVQERDKLSAIIAEKIENLSQEEFKEIIEGQK